MRAIENLATLPESLDGIERERWVAIATTEGSAGWPGTCGRPRCQRAVAAEGVCMVHWCEEWREGDRRARRMAA